MIRTVKTVGGTNMEKSQVYFTTFKATGSENLLQKLHRLMKTAGFEKIDFTFLKSNSEKLR